MDNLLELLEDWMSHHRQSPLDGTISCKTCAAMVLEENADRHSAWHTEQDARLAYLVSMQP